MKLKLDENLDIRLVEMFAEAGHEASTVLHQGISGAPDETVFQAAVDEDRTLVTLDLDFSNPIRFPPRGTAGVLIIRTRSPLLGAIRLILESALPELEKSDIRGKLWILEPGRIRVYDPEGAE